MKVDVRVTTPTRPLPEAIERWTSRLRWIRALDTFLAWLTALLALKAILPGLPPQADVIAAAGLVLLGTLVPRLRMGWRPISAITTLRLSRDLRAGDRAWFVHGQSADLVLVTARHGLRVIVAKPGHDAAEGVNVRRTRVLLLPD